MSSWNKIREQDYELDDDDLMKIATLLRKKYPQIVIQTHDLLNIQIAIAHNKPDNYLRNTNPEQHAINFHYLPGKYNFSIYFTTFTIRIQDYLIDQQFQNKINIPKWKSHKIK